jgi:4-alpha-glucanotransferase
MEHTVDVQAARQWYATRTQHAAAQLPREHQQARPTRHQHHAAVVVAHHVAVAAVDHVAAAAADHAAVVAVVDAVNQYGR